MSALFYRDGTPYTGHEALNFNPDKGEARVVVQRPCPDCKGIKQTEARANGWRCLRCGGAGVMRQKSWLKVYTQARLDELNGKQRKKEELSKIALREAKLELARFAKSRARLIEDIEKYAARSARLQELWAVINEGVVLTDTQIREACREIGRFK